MNAQLSPSESATTITASHFGRPTFAKLDAAGTLLPDTAAEWAAVRVTLGDQAFVMLAGNVSNGARLNHADASTACAAINALGCSDWRLPTLPELEAIRDLSRYNPAVDPAFFSDVDPSWYWTASPDASDPACAWQVGFLSGYVYLDRRGLRALVRAVRSVSASASQ